MDNAILMMASLALTMIIFVLIPELLRRKREAQTQQVEKDHQDSVVLKIPADVAAAIKLPCEGLDRVLKIELAVHLYSNGILPFGPARQLANMSKADFHFLLGRRRIERQYDVEDDEKNLANLEKWEKRTEQN
jgi:predicted HTH domain antitoxin